MIKPIFIVDEFEAITENINTAILSTIQQNEIAAKGDTKIEKISFHKGLYTELLETLAQRDLDKEMRNFKYPLIYLQQPFLEQRARVSGFYGRYNLRLLIIHQTVATYKTTDRYEDVFKPVLYPIYLELLKQIADYSLIVESNEETIKHDKSDLPFGGKIGAGVKDTVILNDFVDAIDVTNLDLQFYSKTC